MAIALDIAFAAGQGTGTAVATSLATPTTANFIVVAATTTANNVVSSFTDGKGNTYFLLPSITAANGNVITMGYALNATIGGSFAVTVNCAVSNAMAVAAASFNGIATSSAFDKSATNASSGTAMDSGTTAVTTLPNELLIGAGEQGTGSNVAWTAGASFTLASHMDLASAGRDIYLEYRIVSAAAAYNAPCTSSINGGGGYAAMIATFADTTVPGGGPGPSASLLFHRKNVLYFI